MPKVLLDDDDLKLIRELFITFGWTGAELCRHFKHKKWNRNAVNYAIKKFQTTGNILRRKGGRKPTLQDSVEPKVMELICSQEDKPQSHLSQRKAARVLGVSRSTVQRIAKRHKLKALKKLRAPQLKEAAKIRRTERAANLLKKFDRPSRIHRIVFQDEKDFCLQVPTNHQNDRVYTSGLKKNVADDRLYHTQNKQSLKVMVSCGVSWQGVTRPYFLETKIAKVNAQSYENHLKKQLLPNIDKLYPNNDYIYAQDGATSHTAGSTQNYLKERLGRGRYLTKLQWPPSSPDLNPLDYYFWNQLSNKVYEGRNGKPFDNEEQLKKRIRQVWNDAVDIEAIRKAIKQFRCRLRAVVFTNGNPIKQYFG